MERKRAEDSLRHYRELGHWRGVWPPRSASRAVVVKQLAFPSGLKRVGGGRKKAIARPGLRTTIPARLRADFE